MMPVRVESQEIPVRNDDFGDGRYGAKRRNGRVHAGLDIKAPVGARVYAAKSGIAACKDMKNGYGKLVTIYHVDGYQTRYAHLSKFTIKKYQWVNQGDIIGFVGKTGNAAANGLDPHLHFEIRKGSKTLDPFIYLY